VALALRGSDAAELRLPGPVWRIQVTGTSRLGVRPATSHPRIADLRLGARGPPGSCVA
jgi:hypothetical protein